MDKLSAAPPSVPTPDRVSRRRFLLTVAGVGSAFLLGRRAIAGASRPEKEHDPALLTEPLSESGFETLFLTWAGDPTSTMRIQWLAPAACMPQTLEFRSASGGAWQSATSQTQAFGVSPHVRVHRIDLKGLEPGSDYLVRLPDGGDPFGFATAPATLDRPLVFAEGGDIGISRVVARLHGVAAAEEPLFGLVGGDLSYSDGVSLDTEIRYYKMWHAGMVTASGRLIPMVAAIGNHEVIGGYDQPRSKAPFFYSLFDSWAGDEGAYRAIDFGNYLSLVILDSNHTCPVAAQTEWLRTTLAERSRVPHRFVVYHVPAYPSVRNFDQAISVAIREQWLPVIDEAGIGVVFEHHDHAYKRTKPLRAGSTSPGGTVFFGDGAWGRDPRPLRADGPLDFFDKRLSSWNVINVTLTRSKQSFTVHDETGTQIDALERALA